MWHRKRCLCGRSCIHLTHKSEWSHSSDNKAEERDLKCSARIVNPVPDTCHFVRYRSYTKREYWVQHYCQKRRVKSPKCFITLRTSLHFKMHSAPTYTWHVLPRQGFNNPLGSHFSRCNQFVVNRVLAIRHPQASRDFKLSHSHTYIQYIQYVTRSGVCVDTIVYVFGHMQNTKYNTQY